MKFLPIFFHACEIALTHLNVICATESSKMISRNETLYGRVVSLDEKLRLYEVWGCLRLSIPTSPYAASPLLIGEQLIAHLIYRVIEKEAQTSCF